MAAAASRYAGRVHGFFVYKTYHACAEHPCNTAIPLTALQRLQLDYVTPQGGNGCGFTVVRDDLLHPIAGGNKLRKLDALLPALLASGTTDIVRHTPAAVSPLPSARAACRSINMANILPPFDLLADPSYAGLLSRVAPML